MNLFDCHPDPLVGVRFRFVPAVDVRAVEHAKPLRLAIGPVHVGEVLFGRGAPSGHIGVVCRFRHTDVSEAEALSQTALREEPFDGSKIDLSDPYPASLALAHGEDDATCQNMVRKSDGDMTEAEGDKADGTCQNTVCQNTARKDDEAEVKAARPKAMTEGLEARMTRGMACRKARRKAAEMLAECGRSQRGVRLALAARLAPDQVPPEVEFEERRRQGLPPRDGLARRFVQMMA